MSSAHAATRAPTPQAWLPPSLWDGCGFDGDWHRLTASRPAIEPATSAVLGTIGDASPTEIARACAAARAVQSQWACTDYERRAAILRAAGRLAEDNSDEIAEWIVRESGSTRPKARFEVAITIKALYEASAMPSQPSGQMLPSERGRLSLARRRPLGVVGVISPFNFPLYLAMRAVAPALAVGNAVVVKPDTRTAICGGFVIARLFEAAGLPRGVLHVLPGGRAAGEALCSDPHTAMIQFTGSTNAGRAVAEIAGRHLKKVSLELGGKNALIILDDADIALAVRNTRWSAYLHQGQICMAAGRVLVQSRIAEEFIRQLAQTAQALRVGDPAATDVALGPMINDAQVAHAERIVADTVAAGATLAAGGRAHDRFFLPTVLTGVAKGMRAYEEEVFGPVALVTSFDTDKQAVDAANDTTYGLAAGIITNSIARALSISEQLRVGLVHINDQTVNDDVVNPFGGVGVSGNGTSIGGPANWEEFTQWQWMTIRGTPPHYPL